MGTLIRGLGSFLGGQTFEFQYFEFWGVQKMGDVKIWCIFCGGGGGGGGGGVITKLD